MQAICAITGCKIHLRHYCKRPSTPRGRAQAECATTDRTSQQTSETLFHVVSFKKGFTILIYNTIVTIAQTSRYVTINNRCQMYGITTTSMCDSAVVECN